MHLCKPPIKLFPILALSDEAGEIVSFEICFCFAIAATTAFSISDVMMSGPKWMKKTGALPN